MAAALTLDESFPATSISVPAIRHAVAAIARAHGASTDRLTRITLAVTEACANVVVHAYGDRSGEGTIGVRVLQNVTQLDVVISDQGHGFRPRFDSPGLGLGLPLMAQLADELEVLAPSSGRGTEIHLRFALV